MKTDLESKNRTINSLKTAVAKTLKSKVKVLGLLLVFVFPYSCKAQLFYDFVDTCGPGKVMYYSVTSNVEPYTVKVFGGYDTTGHLVIPDTVRRSNILYSVTSIMQMAFYGDRGLISVEIPQSVREIERLAFGNCAGLTSVTWNAQEVLPFEPGTYHPFHGCTGLTNLTFGEQVRIVPDYAFYGLPLVRVTFSNNITNIGRSAFENCSSLLMVNIPNSVLTIGSYAFAWSGLSSVIVPNYLRKLDTATFYSCDQLSSVVLGSSLDTIADLVFAQCPNLRSVLFENSLKHIGKTAFAASSIEVLNLPASLRTIDDYAFARCDSLRTLNFGSSLLTIGNYAFADCDTLSTVVIPNSVKQIGNSAFWNCRSLDSLVLGFSLETIGESAFEECSSMRTVKIGNSLTTIGKRAFYGCSMLKSLIIPPLVTSIGDWAFAYCNSLEYVTAKPGTPPTVDVNTWGISIQTPLYVPCGKYNDYAEAEYWKEFVNIEERPVDYTIVLNANNPSHGKVVYNCPTSSIEAVPSEWRYFVKWEDGNTQNPRHVVITSDTMFTAIFEIGMGANEPMALRSLKFYPNPTNGVVSFNRDDIQKVEVMDLNGKLLDVQEYSTSVDFSNLSSGTYILRISTPDGIAIRKLIKK